MAWLRYKLYLYSDLDIPVVYTGNDEIFRRYVRYFTSFDSLAGLSIAGIGVLTDTWSHNFKFLKILHILSLSKHNWSHNI